MQKTISDDKLLELAKKRGLKTASNDALLSVAKKRGLIKGEDGVSNLLSSPLINIPTAAAESFATSLQTLPKTAEKIAPAMLQYGLGVPKEITTKALEKGLKPPEIPIRQVSTPGVSQTIGSVLGYVPLAVATEEALPITAETALGKAAQVAAQGGAFGAGITPENPLFGALEGAILSPALSATMGLGGAVAKPLMAPTLTAKKAFQTLFKKGFSEELFPFMQSKTNNILNDLKGNQDKNITDEVLFNTLKQHYDELLKTTEEIPANARKFVPANTSVGDYYGKLSQLEPKLKGEFNRAPYDAVIDPKMKDLSALIETVGDTSPIAVDLKQQLNILNSFKNTNISDFKTLDNLKKVINANWEGLPYNSPLKGIYTDIKKGIRDTIKENVLNNATNKDFIATYLEADKRFKDEIVPFREVLGRESPFYSAYKGKKDVAGLAKDYIQPNKLKDSTEKIENLFKISPNEATKKLAVYNVFKDTENDPKEFIKRYAKLGNKQKELLFPNQTEDLNKIEEFSKKYPKAFNAKSIESLGLMPRVASYLGAGVLGATGNAPEAIGALVAPYILKQGAKKIASSPKLAEFMTKELPTKGVLENALTGYSPLTKGQIKNTLLAAAIENQ